MATFEERLTAIEQEHTELKHDNAELKQKIDLQTIAIGGLVNKAMLERINEKNDKIFQTLIAHDELTNRQLSELREKVEVQVEGKIAGMQTEMRQGFAEQKKQIADLNGKVGTLSGEMTSLNGKVGTLNGEMTSLNGKVGTLSGEVTSLNGKVGTLSGEVATQGQKLDQILLLLKSPGNKPE